MIDARPSPSSRTTAPPPPDRDAHLLTYRPDAGFALAGDLPLIFSVDAKLGLLPHFVAHYRAQGVTDFLCAAWGGADLGYVRRCLAGTSHLVAATGSEFYLGFADAHFQNQMRAAHVPPRAWYAVADLDEFHEVPGMSLREAASAADGDGATAVAGRFVDRVAADGSLPARLDADIWAQFPLQTRMSARVSSVEDNKVLLARGDIEIHSGHHRHEGVEWCVEGRVHHFKWWGDLRERLDARFERIRQARPTWGGECRRVAEALDAHAGRLPLAHAAPLPLPDCWRSVLPGRPRLSESMEFVTDWVSDKDEWWRRIFAPLKDRRAAMLEVGFYEGRSAAWFLENVLTHPRSTLVSIDHRPEIGDANRRIIRSHPVHGPKFLFRASDALRWSSSRRWDPDHWVEQDPFPVRYDAIYLDGGKEASYIHQVASLLWDGLRPGGLLLFDDYDWRPTSAFDGPKLPEVLPKVGIDAFLATHAPWIARVEHGKGQVAVTKGPHP